MSSSSTPSTPSTPKEVLEWEEQIKKARALAMDSGIDWSKININPAEVGYKMGPIMSEAEFKKHCERTGTKPHILRK